jgi:hypothetical protein
MVKAVHRACAKRALMKIPSLEDCEQRAGQTAFSSNLVRRHICDETQNQKSATKPVR